MLTWVDSSSSGSVYWMSGMAGTGKTTIAYSLCQELDASRRLAASFFCSRLLPECRNVSLIIPTIAYQLARCSHPFRFVLSAILENDPDVHTRLPHLQFDALISQPLLKVKDTLPDHFTVVIDALDECDDKESTSQMLDVLLTKSSRLPVRFVVSSRPEPEIRDEMTKQSDQDQAESRVVLHELDEYAVQADIETYLRVSLAPMKPDEDEIATLVERSGILFIYAATVVRYIGYDKFRRNPRARLAKVLNGSNAAIEKNKHKEIDELYTTILHAALDDPDLDDLDREDMKQVLHTIICAQEPLMVSTLSAFLELDDYDRVYAALRPLWSVLHISGDGEMVTTLHASFPDFMLDSFRSKQYHCSLLAQNRILALRCFEIFRRVHPPFNICGLESSYLADDQVEGLEKRIQRSIPSELFYAAQYWAVHLTACIGMPDLIPELEEFLSKRLLLWMEVMNLEGYSANMPEAIQQLELWETDGLTELRSSIHDAWRFTKTFALSSVSSSTPHIYTSMLLFWPESSPIPRQYLKHFQGVIKLEGNAIERRQHVLIASWGFDRAVNCAAFSPDGTEIALATHDKILVLSPETGRQVLPPFTEHKQATTSVQFSPDGEYVISSSMDNAICVWSMHSGELVLGPLQTHASDVTYVAFMLGGTRLVSGSSDSTICLWDASNGDLISNWTVGPDEQKAVYSSGENYIGCCGASANIYISNIRDGRYDKSIALSHEDNSIIWRSIDVFPTAALVASGSQFGDVYIWDLTTGLITLGPLAVAGTPKNLYIPIEAIAFSPDGSRLVSCSRRMGICVWDTKQGNLLLGPLEGHTSTVTSVGFSPDGAYILSSSFDKTIRLWDTRSIQASTDPLPGHTAFIKSVAYFPDGARIVTSASDLATCVWDAETGEIVLGPLQQTYTSDPSPDNTCMVCNTSDGLVILNSQTGDIIRGPLRNKSLVESANFSSDGAYILIALEGGLVQVLATDTCQTLMVIHLPLVQNNDFPTLFAMFSSDGSHIGVASKIFGLHMYDTSNGRLLYDPIAGRYFGTNPIVFSPDGNRFIAGWDSRILVREVESGEVVFEPPGCNEFLITSMAFSPDGTRAVFGRHDHTVCIWDFELGQNMLEPVKWHTDYVTSARFSPDGTRVVTGSNDMAIRVTDITKEGQFLSDSSTPTGSEWELTVDGWIMDEQGRLLVWVPRELRASLMWPRTKLLISRRGWLRLNFAGASIGDSWAECYKHT
ncbi:unnamed protein product [Rhizoctonia solani]|uniref:Nephrocystin 3-like N-terminal domain-containing protein n=1 Tax=Rhizoctonia solani TaxID=456999 RepID=A0A8H3ADI0_9AGAM|nr:unnamed protein product [Rhizoctonia solani]